MKRVIFGMIVLLPMLILGGASAAELRAQADIERLTQESQVILVGQCKAINSAWNARRTIISTYVTYDVEEVIKGPSSNQQAIVKTLGGTVGSITQTVVGGPRFEIGERDLLFLTKSDEPKMLRIQGLRQGKIKIHSHPKTGDTVRLRDAPRLKESLQAGHAIARGKAAQRSVTAPPTKPFGQLLQEIRQHLKKRPPH